MPSPTQATPEMVEQVGSLEEVELTKEGVRPLTATANVETSQPASTDGAAVEPTAKPEETAPTEVAKAPEPTQVLSPARPAIEVIPGKQPAATAPVARAAEETKEEKKEETGPTEAELLSGLKTYGEAQAEDARRAAQGAADRRAATLDRQLAEQAERNQANTTRIRELESRDLTDDERKVALEKYAQDDVRDELNAYRTQLVDFHRTVYIDSLSFDFGKYGVTRESLEQMSTPEDMELACERQKSAFLGEQISQNGATPVVAKTPKEEVKPVEATAEVKKEAKPAAQVPAGATAVSDVGGGSAPAETAPFDESASGSALQTNLGNMAWDTVVLPRR